MVFRPSCPLTTTEIPTNTQTCQVAPFIRHPGRGQGKTPRGRTKEAFCTRLYLCWQKKLGNIPRTSMNVSWITTKLNQLWFFNARICTPGTEYDLWEQSLYRRVCAHHGSICSTVFISTLTFKIPISFLDYTSDVCSFWKFGKSEHRKDGNKISPFSLLSQGTTLCILGLLLSLRFFFSSECMWAYPTLCIYYYDIVSRAFLHGIIYTIFHWL